MHISRVMAQHFKRFSNLEIVDIPRSAKLVILAGPNGNGKSSLFDLFLMDSGANWEQDYHLKITDPKVVPPSNIRDVEFHERPAQADSRKRFYFRTAYRNQPAFNSGPIKPVGEALSERRIGRSIDNDVAVAPNYQRLYALGLESAFEDDETTQLGQWKRKLLGDVQDALSKVLPELILENLGNPFKVQTFRFSKGASKDYNYMNLSGGEKATFDLLLDFVVKKREYDDTVFCIDEPEAHLNPRVHGKMLDALLSLVESKSQLWIATHAIGMMRRARDLYYERPGEIVFLDFDRDFDKPQVLRPVVPDRTFWERSLAVALDDLSALVAPKTIVACESSKNGKPGEGYDAAIYNEIFAREFPEIRFISIGASTDMDGDRFLVLQAVSDLTKGTKVIRLIDRDGMTDKEKGEKEANGFSVLGRRHIESYLFDDEVLVKLCKSVGKEDQIDAVRAARHDALSAAVANNHPADHMKAASGRLFLALQRILRLPGKTSKAFMRDVLAPLIIPGMPIYDELKSDIFGDSK